jgi:hypothetical protein
VSSLGSFLPEPPGFSGSLVWDTGYVRKRGQDWSPADATVTGLVFGWPLSDQSDSLIATRIEVVRAFLIQALRHEAAYFRWLGRGKPYHDELTDCPPDISYRLFRFLRMPLHFRSHLHSLRG